MQFYSFTYNTLFEILLYLCYLLNLHNISYSVTMTTKVKVEIFEHPIEGKQKLYKFWERIAHHGVQFGVQQKIVYYELLKDPNTNTIQIGCSNEAQWQKYIQEKGYQPKTVKHEIAEVNVNEVQKQMRHFIQWFRKNQVPYAVASKDCQWVAQWIFDICRGKATMATFLFNDLSEKWGLKKK